MHFAARQPPDQPCVDRSEHQLALLGPLPRARHVVQNPFDLRGAEIGVDDQARLFANPLGFSFGLQRVAVLRGPAVLPYDGVVDRFLRFAVPHDCRLALVGDAYSGYVQPVDVDGRDGFGDHRSLRRPDFVRIVLHPSRFGEILGELPLGHRANLPLAVENDRAGTARSLIQ